MPNPKRKTTTKKRAVSLKDIAGDMNVSLSLVSKVISGRLGTTKVRPEIQEAILKRAAELKYRPNSLASALQRGRTGTIGLIIHPVGAAGSELFREFFKGISVVLEAHRLRLWLRFFHARSDFFSEWDLYSTREVDGLIVAGVHHRELNECLERWKKDELPIVTVYSQDTPLVRGIPNVSIDHEKQAYLITDHLIKQGCRRIAHAHFFETRKKGYRAALKEHGIAYDKELLFDIQDESLDAKSGALAVRTLVESGVKFDGFLAQSDPMAHGAVNELKELGINVPGEVKVVGIDNSPICDVCSPALTSATAEMMAIGKAAMEMLLMQIEDESVSSRIIMPSLVTRGSTDK